MINEQDLSNAIKKIEEKWSNPNARNAKWGNCLKDVTVQNVRGLDCSIEIQHPVTAIAGINGSGKTTFLQICTTAFSKFDKGRFYRMGDWIRNGMHGDSPVVGLGSQVSFSFWDGSPTLAIPYSTQGKRWNYPKKTKNAPQRNVEFIGVAAFSPRIERKDIVHVFKTHVKIRKTDNLSQEMIQSISKILGINYDLGNIHTVGLDSNKWSDSIPQIKRHAITYSEAHMGAGEQKIVRLVSILESLPEKSLIVLEEPEITLHPDAQRGLAWYLMNLSLRKGHQILIATHSTEIFESLPDCSRVLLIKTKTTVEVFNKVSSLKAARVLGRSLIINKQLILVEDEFAKSFLIEILRRVNRQIISQISIVAMGSDDDVRRAVEKFRREGVKCIGIRDGDKGENKEQHLFSLPGGDAPESVLVESSNLKRASKYISDIESCFERAKLNIAYVSASDFSKKIIKRLGIETGLSDTQVFDRLMSAWLDSEDNIKLCGNLCGSFSSSIE